MKYFLLELRKLFALPSYRYTFMATVLFISFMNFIPMVRSDKSEVNWADMFADSFGIILVIVGIGMIIVTAQFTAAEYSNRTAQLSLAAGVSRKNFIFGKCFALIFGVYSLMCIASLFSLILCAIVTILIGKFNLSHLHFPSLFSSLVFSPLKLLPLIMIAFFMTIWIRASTFPIAFLMIYSTIGELFLTAMLSRSPIAKAFDYFPAKIGDPIDAFTTAGLSLAKNASAIERLAREANNYALSPMESIVGIFLYVLFFSVIGYFVFSKQDLSR